MVTSVHKLIAIIYLNYECYPSGIYKCIYVDKYVESMKTVF